MVQNVLRNHAEEFRNNVSSIKGEVMDIDNWVRAENLIYILPVIITGVIYPITNMAFPDYLMVTATFYFSSSLIPTVLNSDSMVPRNTSTTISIGIVLIIWAALKLGLILTILGNLASLSLWIYIFFFRGPE